MKYFLEGFFGSFKLAAALVMAVVGVASAFVRGELPVRRHGHDFQVSRH